jgi:hypothetical protein
LTWPLSIFLSFLCPPLHHTKTDGGGLEKEIKDRRPAFTSYSFYFCGITLLRKDNKGIIGDPTDYKKKEVKGVSH